MRKVIPLLLICICSSAFGFPTKEIIDGSDKIEPNVKALEFISKYSSAIRAKNISAYIALLAPKSHECYKVSKHPEYYQTEFKKWIDFPLGPLKEFRKFKASYDDKNFYKMMDYPERPTHIAIFNAAPPSAGVQSVEIQEKDGSFFISYRCM